MINAYTDNKQQNELTFLYVVYRLDLIDQKEYNTIWFKIMTERKKRANI